MMAASLGQGEDRNAEGVISGHAYSLISIHEVSDDSGREIKLLRLRNPWGSSEWTGAWSDQSELWTPELKEAVGFVDGDDGLFFIELSDYLAHFSWTSVCVENDSYKYKHSQTQRSFRRADSQAFFRFTLTETVDPDTHAFVISAIQQGERLRNYRETDPAKRF